MALLYTFLIGLLIGAVAKFLMPGRDPGGFIVTSIIGVIGSFLASYIGQTLGLYRIGEPSGFLASVLGAMLLLLIYRVIAGRTAAV